MMITLQQLQWLEAVLDNMEADVLRPELLSASNFLTELKALIEDGGEHRWDCKCAICR